MTVDWKENYVSNFIPKNNSNGILRVIRIHSYHNFVLGLDFLIKWTHLIYNLLSLSFSYFKVYYEIKKKSIWIFYFLRPDAETVFIQFSNIYDYSNFFKNIKTTLHKFLWPYISSNLRMYSSHSHIWCVKTFPVSVLLSRFLSNMKFIFHLIV